MYRTLQSNLVFRDEKPRDLATGYSDERCGRID
jgi:hypothetical protein